ncbi:MAG TPA: CHRD domain-containing protein [Longimicrobiales bacterium]|nr:CHRD domain-containing protein [Longimicrobiales bacterium]
MNATRSWLGLLTLVPLTVLAACGAPEPDEGMETGNEPAATPTEEPQAQTPMESAEAFSITLDQKNESGVTGSATATREGDSVVVDVQVTGVSADGELPAHIHEGTCAEPGSVIAPLTSVQVTGGSGSSTTTLAADQVPADQGTFVQVHDPDGQPIACGDIQGEGGM